MQFDRVLFVGEATHRDFCEPWRYLQNTCRELRTVSSPDETNGVLREFALPPELIVVAQLWPGQFRQSHIEALHRAAPLSRLIALLGSWCEGEMCSGTPWSGIPRLYWHQFIARMQGGLVGGALWEKAWRLPRTATDAERLDAACRPRPARQGRMLIAAADWLSYEGLAEGCAQAGYAVTWLKSECDGLVPGAIAGIWDDSSNQSARPCPFVEFAARVRPAPAIALLHFPRPADRQRAADAGAAVIYAKPFSWDDLLSDLARMGQLAAGARPVPLPAYPNSIPA